MSLLPGKTELMALAAAGRWDVYDAAEIHARYEDARERDLAGGLILGGRLNALVYADDVPICDTCDGAGEIECRTCGQDTQCPDCEGSSALDLMDLLEDPEGYGVRIDALSGETIDPEALSGYLDGRAGGDVFLTPDAAAARLLAYQQEKSGAAAPVPEAA